MGFNAIKWILAIFYCTIFMVTTKAQDIVNSDSLSLPLSSNNDPKVIAEEALKLSKTFEDDNTDKALQYASLAFDLAEHNDDIVVKVNSLLQLGKIYFLISNYKNAMESVMKAKELATEHKMEKELGHSFILIGRVNLELISYDKGSENFFESLKIFEKIKDSEGIAESFGYIGNAFYTQKQNEKALDYMNKALELAKQIGNLKLVSRQLNNIAVVYLGLKNYDTALAYLNEALEIEKQIGNVFYLGIRYYNIGYAQLKQKKYDDALKNFHQSLEYYSQMDNQLHISNCYLAFGQCYYDIDSIDQSIASFSEALERGMKNHYYMVIIRAANSLHGINIERKDTIKAYKYSVIESIAKDSVTNSNKQALISKFELQYLYDKMEYENKLAQQTKNSIITIVFICLFLGLIILFLLFTHHRMKAKKIAVEKLSIEKELGFKNKELTINLMSLMKKNDLIADISTELVEMEKEATSTEIKKVLSLMSKKIRQNSDDKILREFSSRFQEVHSGFYESLLQKFPDLSQNELKICAFLRLNMSTKEISELTGQRTLTIENARYRLRKKLGISNSNVNLVTFLTQI